MNIILDTLPVKADGLFVPSTSAPLVHAVEYRGGILSPLRAGVRYPYWLRASFGELDGRQVFGPFVACANSGMLGIAERKLLSSRDTLTRRRDSLASLVAVPQGETLPNYGFSQLIAAHKLAFSHARFGEECSVEVWLSMLPKRADGVPLVSIDLTSSRIRARIELGARR